ncbi:hypothetical protein [Candidatus Williamhamiltonella defendens]|uniref:DUF1640 domain-containing protein n=1 Tax=Candidatus Hamiltonella defensa (Bemisia tabaci) TaxID=672795 RepID=A0A249DXI2_9ENTR|nr:hypothetical protein [Candidatus Hamiltonella defensa]ASX25975.1 DUF1640 domain-containing protein [Candidatus Hamiltonella defensa (Bemisia tabaci)]CED78507.1 Putative protein p47 [Candidatus Hamiltonella defensa (Bemisia tabaci)]
MSQMAFDTLQASEALETAGMSREQARAISLIVRRSHEVADVATKADIAEVKRDIADVRKDMDTQFADIRKDMDNKLEKLGLSLTIKMGGMIGFLVVSIGLMLKYLR